MSNAPNLLNDDHTASMATAIMMSHHGIRRDLGRLAHALERLPTNDTARAEVLREQWKNLAMTLHGHHQAEDTGVFPTLAAEHPSVRDVIERLSEDHRRIDPLVDRGQAAFADLPDVLGALAIARELRELLDAHLAVEEREIIPFLRSAKSFPEPPDDEALAMYAQGFAWSMHGIAPDVLEQVERMLPAALVARLPEARAAFAERYRTIWGSSSIGETRTPIPAE
jgi:hemerythrin-like domain-containing protein